MPFVSCVSINANTRFGFDGATARPIRPYGSCGRPLPVRRCHVAPPLVDLYNPLPGPPLLELQPVRRYCHIAAYIVFGVLFDVARSAAPVSLSMKSVLFQVLPPSAVR